MIQKRQLFLGLVYLILASLFIMIAVNDAHPSIWNSTTLLFAAVATFDIRLAFRYLFNK